MPRTRPAYLQEFRREAVELLLAGRSPRELAESLGVSRQTLRNWRRQAQRDVGERDDGPTSDEREELSLVEEGRGSLEDLSLLAQRGVLTAKAPQTEIR